MISALLFLGILVFTLMVLFGRAEPQRFYKFFIFLIVAPILLSIGLSHTFWLFDGLPLWLKVLAVLLTPFAILALLRSLFPGKKGPQQALGFVFYFLAYVISFPFRLIWRTTAFMFQRERRTNRLNPYRPAVGGRPPFIQERDRERYLQRDR